MKNRGVINEKITEQEKRLEKKGNYLVNKYIKNFKKYQYLLSELVKKDIKLKYRKSKLGILWTLLEPILTALVLSFVFSQMRPKKGMEYSFIVYILTGRLLFSFFSGATKSALKSIRSNGSMIKKVYVPKYIYPLASVLSNYIIFLISLIVLFGAIIICRDQVNITIHMVEAVVPLILILMISLGIGMFLATVSVFFRDMEYLWSVVSMMIMYCSAIFYDPTSAAGAGKEWLFKINPIYDLIFNLRNAVLFGKALDMKTLLYSGVIAVISLIIGFYMFYKKQDEFILYI